MPFTKNISKNIGKNISNNLSGKYIQTPFYHAKKSTPDAINTDSKRETHKATEVTSVLIGNKNDNKITKALKSLPQNKSDTVESEKKGLKDKYVPPEKGQQITDKLRIF